MRKLILATTLLALVTWLYPVNVTAKTIDLSTSKTVSNLTTNSLVGNYADGNLVIKDNVIQETQPTNPSEVHTRHTNPTLSRIKAQETSAYSGRNYSKEEVQQLIRDYAAQYHIEASLPLRVANCESGYNQFSKNHSSTASGVAQYLASTWRNTEAGRQSTSVFDADANVHMMIASIASGGIGNWNASRHCWQH